MDAFQVLIGFNLSSSSESEAQKSFVSRFQGTKICIVTSGQTFQEDVSTFFPSLTSKLRAMMNDITETLDLETSQKWIQLYQGICLVHQLWTSLQDQRSFRKFQEDAFPKQDLILFVAYVHYLVAITNLSEAHLNSTEACVWTRTVAKCFNAAFELLMLVCADAQPSGQHNYDERVISILTRYIRVTKDWDVSFVTAFTRAVGQLFIMLRRLTLSLKHLDTIAHILDVIHELEISLSYYASLLVDSILDFTVQRYIPNCFVDLCISTLQLLQPPVKLIVSEKTGLRKDIFSTAFGGGLELLCSRCFALLSQMQNSVTDPCCFENLLTFPSLKEPLKRLTYFIWDTAEIVLCRRSFLEHPVYPGESQLTTTLLLLLPEFAAFHDPILTNLQKGVTIILTIVSADEEKFKSKWCGGVDSRKLGLQDHRSKPDCFNLCPEYIEYRALLTECLSRMERDSGEKFCGLYAVQELERSIGLVNLISSFVRKYPLKESSPHRHHYYQHPFFEELLRSIKGSKLVLIEKFHQAQRIYHNLQSLVAFLHPLNDQRIFSKEKQKAILDLAKATLDEITLTVP